jgi:hypothetical protein
VSEPAAASRLCRACGEAIAPTARICKVCKSPQGWTRLLFQWKEIGLAILALVPLWKATGSLAELARPRPKVPEVRASALGCDAQSFRLALTNAGNAAGLVAGIRLAYESDGRRIETGAELVPESGEAGVVLQPGAVVTLALAPRIAGVPTVMQFPTGAGDCRAIALVGVTTFEENNSVVEAACGCP